MRRARSRPPQDRGREDGSQKGVGNVDAENGRSKQDDRATKPVRFWIHVTGTGARRTEAYAVLDGDGVEDGESEVMTQDDEQREQRERPDRGAGPPLHHGLQSVLDKSRWRWKRPFWEGQSHGFSNMAQSRRRL